jgi:hypothetical protein
MAKRTYDIRVRNAVARSGDPDLFLDLDIPRSTALQWIREGVKEVVTHPSLGKSCDALIEENFALQKTCAAEKAKNELVQISLRVTGFQMQYMRIAAGELKKKLLDSIKIAKAHLPLKECLETIGLTAARYHSWVKRQILCQLPDQSTCPKLSPTKITSKETSLIKELITTKDYAHFSINSLAVFAKTKDWNSRARAQSDLARRRVGVSNCERRKSLHSGDHRQCVALCSGLGSHPKLRRREYQSTYREGA